MSLSSKFFVLGGLAIAVDALLPAGPASSVLYCAIAICALIAVPVGILTSRKTSPHSWWIMTAALACWVTGDVITGISVNRSEERRVGKECLL